MIHKPVLFNETLELLDIKPDGFYVDATFGGGGHSKGILNKLSKKGKLLAFDHDLEVEKYKIHHKNFELISENFKFIKYYLQHFNISEIDGIIADLGVNSSHFDIHERGFSYRNPGPIDMRMNLRLSITAEKILKEYSVEKLVSIFSSFGELRNAKQVANFIVNNRNHYLPSTTTELTDWIKHLVKGDKIKYWSQFFQALRIEVNQEIESLTELLKILPQILKVDGVAVIITFHSIEDRLVKNYFANYSVSEAEKHIYGFKKKQNLQWELLTKKPILPSQQEISSNSRCKSAKLRAAKLKIKSSL